MSLKVRVDTLPFLRAFLEGYLLPHEYNACLAFATFVLTCLVMGLLLSLEEPAWVGHLIWAGTFVVVFTAVPMIKWFGT
ncbi:unnamed protein product, partial [Discosporangium mesarthrocarpum]